MTVYVDSTFDYGFKRKRYCHMMTDGDISELHIFAKKIGLKRCWFQAHKSHPHYDLTENMLHKAIEHGATLVRPKELLRRCSKRCT